ncbi:hypothetical protein IJ674_10395 [bacterium]|nr:hypothetical protein [bacterium]
MENEQNVSTTDNQDLDSQIQEIFDSEDVENDNQDNTADTEEQEEQTEETESEEETQDNITKCPDKFLNTDGTVNVENLLKSYQQLEPLLNQKADWEKEKAILQKKAEYAEQLQLQQQSLALQQGYRNSEDMELSKEVANAVSNEYEKYLYTVSDPERVQGLLAVYSKTPNPAILEKIEDEFSVDVVKRVSVFAERYKNQVIERQNTEKYEQYKQEAQNFVKKAFDDYPDWFKIPEFVEFFKSALEVKGDAFETSALIGHLQKLKDVFRKQFEEEQKLNSENEKEKDSLKNLTPKANQKVVTTKRVEDYTPEELDSAIEALV